VEEEFVIRQITD